MSRKSTKSCPLCGDPLYTRKNGITGEEFLGCIQYPNCKYTEPLPEDVRLRLAGAPMMPGFEEVSL